MRGRGMVAAAAVTAGAAAAHALDVAGLLPGVHESVGVRAAMGPLAVAGWLLLAASAGWLAARTRPVPVGAAAALLVSGVPELVGRHDIGAVLEPGAMAGGLLQWALLLLVLAAAVLLERRLDASLPPAPAPPTRREPPRRPVTRPPVADPALPGRSRAPPRSSRPHSLPTRGQLCLHHSSRGGPGSPPAPCWSRC